MVSLGVLVLCLGLQIHSCAVTPGLEQRAAQVMGKMQSVEQDALHAHYARKHAAAHRQEAARAVNPTAESGDEDEVDDDDDAEEGLFGLGMDTARKFRAGELTDANDPNYLRYLELRDELKAIELRMPVIRFGYRPALDGFWSLISSMFAHGGWLHLIGNMWFLYLVGCNLEDRWGRWQFLLFYMVAGVLAALSFGALHPDMEEPLVGASGAIAGAMGAFMVCYARTRVKLFYLYFMFFTMPRWGTFRASTWVVMALWIADQLLMAYVEVSGGHAQVAHSAHAGGFLFGALVALLLRRLGVDHQLDAASEQAAEAGSDVWTEHPLYLKAMELRDKADDATATERLIQLLAEQPKHLGAREALFDLGVAHRDLRAIDLGLPFLIDHYAQKQDHRTLLRLLHELRQAVPNYGLTDQELLRFATAAQKTEDGALAIRLVGELLQHYPGSSFAPRALWVAAEVQGRLGAAELQRQTLGRIVQSFPEHACARLAREQLGSAGALA